MNTGICMGCFEPLNGFSVCGHCGWYEGAEPEHMYHLHPGTVLRGRYIVGNSVGVGGFGITYRAWDANLNTLVAVKEFYPAGLVSRVPGEKEIVIFSGEKKQEFEKSLSRFLDEAKTMAKFNGHSNIVNVFDFFEENNTAYIVMEFLDGINLKDYLASLPDNRMDVDTAVMITDKILDAMTEIHSKGVIHRDISPDNIQITMKNEIKIFDLGAARLAKGDKEETRSIVVKTGYTPPEQYREKSKQGPFTDLYSVGAVLYKLITGVAVEESIDRMVEDHLERPSKLGIKLGSNLEKAIMKSLALKPELRFQSAAQFKEAIANKKIVDYPEVELKKRRKRRIILSSLIAAFSVAFFSGFGIYMYNFTKGVNYLLAEDDTINVWMPVSTNESDAESQKKMYKQLVDEFIKNAEKPANGEEKGNKFEVNLVTVPQDEFKDKLIEAIEKGGEDAPTVFNTDYLGDSLNTYAAPLDNLVKSISSDECIIYDNYENIYPSKTEMPTGIYANVIYVNTSAANKAGITIPEKIENFESLLESATNKDGIYTVAIAEDNVDDALISMIDGSLYNIKNKTINPEVKDAFIKIGTAIDKQQFDYSNEKTPNSYIRENALVYYVDDTNELRNFREYMPGYYSVLPLLNDGKLVASMTKHVGINKKVSENKQLVGMQLIRFLLSPYSQDIFHVQNKIALPVNEASLKEYLKYNADIEFISDYISDLKVVGEGRLSCYYFNVKLYDNILINKEPYEKVEEYLKEKY